MITAQELTEPSHIVVMNRWRERYADYAAYLDHRWHRVTYVTTDVGQGSVPDQAADIALVAATDDLAQVTGALEQLEHRHGPVGGLIALKEDDLLVAAELRHARHLAGQHPCDLLRFRDKLLMVEAVAAAGLPTPRTSGAASRGEVLRFARATGWPVVLKPRMGSSSEGVVVLDSERDLDELVWPDRPMMVQDFDPRPIFHVDGIFAGDRLLVWRASRYINSCLDFRGGAALGSVEEDDPIVLSAIQEATTDYLRALTRDPTAFHLEMFVDRHAPAVSCSFLEVGARVGGAEIPFIWRELHGYDLMASALRIQLGLPPAPPPQRTVPNEVGGWLLAPAPAARPCVITEATSMLGSSPGPYAESLLAPGEILPAADAYYEHVGGRFRFRGSNSAAVERAIVATASSFRVSGSALPATDREATSVPTAGGPAPVPA
ncbi:acetyl-CoA carboxylase biotin carboxylase subunit family protein [Geodermatophilus sp. DSM 45219]|uniref:ATP-grasp domain-containing protein n=1 Tax=Geodermatophilus sp. DSM 45219 TaxID=1881103 RepID=UPI00088929C4|nr:biotin carboxylase [Geodermatophilus sp. DSM 45219]SDN52882.1 hypothetical protein SAMN05428965_0797 [Geodermatophilus sp. DSM 45219]